MSKKWTRPACSVAALLLTTLAATAMLIVRGPSCGHDFDFHLVSWMEIARGWYSGLIYPHWAASANYGAGEPRFVFYPPGSWMLGALTGSLFGWRAAPWLFTAACLFCAGLSMRHFARRWMSSASATVAACLYIANPYMLFVAYERTAYGELMAAILLPLLLSLAAQQLPPIAGLSVTVAGIWLMNAPSGVMACYTLLWISLLRLAWERRWRAAMRIGAATAIGLTLAGYYLVPAAYQQRWVEIVRVIGPGMRFQDSFLFHRTGEPFHDAVLHTASMIACALLGVALMSFLVWRDALRLQSVCWLASLAPLILFLLLPASAFLWRHLPHLAYVQFNWRWLLVLAPVVALLTIGALAQRTRTGWVILVGCVICALSILLCTRLFHQYCDDEDAVSAQVALMHRGDGGEGTDEYTPHDDDNAEVDQNLPPVRVLVTAGAEEPDSGKAINPPWQADARAERHATIAIEQWTSEARSVLLNTPAAGFAVFRLMDYPAWQVQRNGVDIRQRPRRDDGLLTVPVPQGVSRITIRWRTTPDLWIGRALSLLGVCVLGLVWHRERRNRQLARP